MNTGETTILLVEDDENDVFFMRRALQKANVSFPLQVVTDGQAALDYLQGAQQYNDRSQYPLPTVVFLDLKLPDVHGFEVLAWIRQHPSLRELPVIILTSSPEQRDRRQAQALGAQDYCVKPPTREMVLSALASFGEGALTGSTSIR